MPTSVEFLGLTIPQILNQDPVSKSDWRRWFKESLVAFSERLLRLHRSDRLVCLLPSTRLLCLSSVRSLVHTDPVNVFFHISLATSVHVFLKRLQIGSMAVLNRSTEDEARDWWPFLKAIREEQPTLCSSMSLVLYPSVYSFFLSSATSSMGSRPLRWLTTKFAGIQIDQRQIAAADQCLLRLWFMTALTGLCSEPLHIRTQYFVIVTRPSPSFTYIQNIR